MIFTRSLTVQINIQRSVAYTHISDEQMEFESKNTIPFTLKPPNVKNLGINLTKCVQDSCD